MAWIELLFGIVGGAVVTLLTALLLREKYKLVYQHRTYKLIDDVPSIVKVFVSGVEIRKLRVTHIRIWNRGKGLLDKEELVRPILNFIES